MQEEGLKILSGEITNFKNISQKIVEFNGRSAMIVGKNGGGKSSLIQALTCAVDAKMIPSRPIKEGEQSASTLVKVGGVLDGEYQEFNIDMYFNEAHGRGKLVISDKDGGAIPGGKSMVKSIVGNVGFDILEFIDLGLTKEGKVSTPGVKDQIKTLLQFLPMESQKKLMNLDIEKKEAYDSRTEINKDIKSNELKLRDCAIDPDDIDKYSEKKDDTSIIKDMSAIGDSISTYDRVFNGIETKELKETALEKRIEALMKEMNSCEEELTEVSAEIEKGRAWLEKRERPSMEALTTQLEKVSEHNVQHAKIVELKGFSEKARTLAVDAEAKSDRLKKIESEKKEVFSETPLPVKGLTFDENEILYKGLPFNENQHPSSTIIAVGIQIAMAMNPNLKLLIIKDGSLLDQKILNYILKLVDKKGYQVFVEMVDHTGEMDVTVDFIEGEVK